MIFPDFHTPQVMAIINVTDDSFYSGSRGVDAAGIEERVTLAVESGATILDIGGCSTRPGSESVPVEVEWQRVERGITIARKVSADIAISVDTFRSEIVSRVVDKFGAVIVNDISAGEADDCMFDTVAKLGLPYIAMHMRGRPATMQSLTEYDDIVEEVAEYLFSRAEALEKLGVKRDNIILDPGFGFAKSVEQNYSLLANLDKITSRGYAVLVGLSRKSMIYKPLGITPEESLAVTSALNLQALRGGATILRVHDVKDAVQIVSIYDKGFKHI